MSWSMSVCTVDVWSMYLVDLVGLVDVWSMSRSMSGALPCGLVDVWFPAALADTCLVDHAVVDV